MRSMRSTLSAIFCAAAAIVACQAPGRPPAVPAPKEAAQATPLKPAADHVVVEIHADVDFTKEERQELVAAANMWLDQTGGVADIRIRFDLDFTSITSLREHIDTDIMARFNSDSDLIKKMDCQHAVAQELPCGEDSPYHPKVLGFAWPPGGIRSETGKHIRMGIVHDRIQGKGRLTSVAVHEYGHVLGIDHLPYRHSIMYPSYSDDVSCLTKYDIDAFCELYECGDVAMKPCE